MSDYQEIICEKQRGGVLITLNRPDALNAITRPMLKEIHHALDSAEADPEIRAVVITGAGDAVDEGDQTERAGDRTGCSIKRQTCWKGSSGYAITIWRCST